MTQRNRNPLLATALLALPLLVHCKSDDKPSAEPNPDGGPPVMACTSVDQCGLPRSTCSGNDVVYYTNARCEGGQCVWDEMTSTCPVPGCSAGGCQSPTMTASGVGAAPCGGGFGGGGNAGGCAVAGNGANGGIGGGGSGGLDDDAGLLMCDPDEDAGIDQCMP
jgi:hypothetical protein